MPVFKVYVHLATQIKGKRVLEPQLPAPRSFGNAAERNVQSHVATMTNQFSQQTAACSVEARSDLVMKNAVASTSFPVLSGKKRQPPQSLPGSCSHTQSTKQNIRPRVAS